GPREMVAFKLRVQRRLASEILKCGQKKVWMDPTECEEINSANSRQNVRKLIGDGFIMKRPDVVHSRARVQARLAAKQKGRHTGHGKRKGTRDARLPMKVIWVRRIRVLRRMLRKYREQGKIDKSLYHELYVQVKGAKYKTKRQLMEVIHHLKYEKTRAAALAEQAELAKNKADARRKKRADRLEAARRAATGAAEA
ncbi:RPL19B, partial [Symbiodinium sp. KB8]